jgi:hypothetical protein
MATAPKTEAPKASPTDEIRMLELELAIKTEETKQAELALVKDAASRIDYTANNSETASTTNLYQAMAAAKSQWKTSVGFNSKNPAFKRDGKASGYAAIDQFFCEMLDAGNDEEIDENDITDRQKIMAKNGLILEQRFFVEPHAVGDEIRYLKYLGNLITHAPSDEKVWFKYSLEGNAQDMGKLQTYGKRYSFGGQWGLVSRDEDNDLHNGSSFKANNNSVRPNASDNNKSESKSDDSKSNSVASKNSMISLTAELNKAKTIEEINDVTSRANEVCKSERWSKTQKDQFKENVTKKKAKLSETETEAA